MSRVEAAKDISSTCLNRTDHPLAVILATFKVHYRDNTVVGLSLSDFKGREVLMGIICEEHKHICKLINKKHRLYNCTMLKKRKIQEKKTKKHSYIR